MKYYYTVEDRYYDIMIGEFETLREALKFYKKVSKEEKNVSIGLYQNNVTDELDRELLEVTNI